jgi:glycosyltransferase involved in cell wall biosynthesis
MADQIAARSRWAAKILGILRWLESLPLRRAVAVVPMCEELAIVARRFCGGPVSVLSDVSLLSGSQSTGDSEDLREALGIKGPLAMYIGNLEPYQGIDLMLESFRHAAIALPDASMVVIGGAEADIARYRGKASGLGLEKNVHFVGPRPVGRLDYYMSQADLLVSPRIEGTNTPMKIYSYMDSGRAVLATDLPTHTQALSSREAALVPPTVEEMGEAMRYLLSSPEERARLATGARDLVQQKYSWDAFRANVHRIFGDLEQGLQASGGS